ncbi:hypothetical protein [Acinetobacter nectaris]|uniref:hypothetical protein n=1 Tax=Acinetobacter nectaris TaxID=1219382 RepID=UPI001F3CB6BB|nr:hypothetical protein [Acinetobacter nectaris]MCF9034410.1 hypothetical protein [Acinetobacter nectaris]
MSEFNVGSSVVCISGDTRLFTVKDNYGDFLTLICGNPKELYKYPKKWFRSAKSKEVEAGKRLP